MKKNTLKLLSLASVLLCTVGVVSQSNAQNGNLASTTKPTVNTTNKKHKVVKIAAAGDTGATNEEKGKQTGYGQIEHGAGIVSGATGKIDSAGAAAIAKANDGTKASVTQSVTK
jgi:hypothetical protein